MTTKLPTYIDTDFSTAIVPLEYVKAVKALKACQTIDDAKQWEGKAEALAAWAKIYKNDQAGKEARRLKLHAYRKMGQLAEQLRPTQKATSIPGANSLLEEHGLPQHKAMQALQLSRATEPEFDTAIKEARGICHTAYQFRGRGRSNVGKYETNSDAYAWLCGRGSALSVFSFRSKLLSREPREVALALAPDERERARAVAIDIVNWLDELDRCIPRMVNPDD
jgi:hypothetical protein